MNKFRITQTRPLCNVLPYEVEECHRVWYLPWPVWRSLQERTFTGRRYLTVPRRFQTVQGAQLFVEQKLVLRASQEAEVAHFAHEQRQRQQLPRVVQVLHPTMPA